MFSYMYASGARQVLAVTASSALFARSTAWLKAGVTLKSEPALSNSTRPANSSLVSLATPSVRLEWARRAYCSLIARAHRTHASWNLVSRVWYADCQTKMTAVYHSPSFEHSWKSGSRSVTFWPISVTQHDTYVM